MATSCMHCYLLCCNSRDCHRQCAAAINILPAKCIVYMLGPVLPAVPYATSHRGLAYDFAAEWNVSLCGVQSPAIQPSDHLACKSGLSAVMRTCTSSNATNPAPSVLEPDWQLTLAVHYDTISLTGFNISGHSEHSPPAAVSLGPGRQDLLQQQLNRRAEAHQPAAQRPLLPVAAAQHLPGHTCTGPSAHDDMPRT